MLLASQVPSEKGKAESSSTTITLSRDVKAKLEEGAKRGETWNDILGRLHSLKIPEPALSFCQSIKKAYEESDALKPMSIDERDILNKVISRIGIILGYRESFSDFGVSKAASATVVAFIDEDLYTVQSMLIIGGLRYLIDKYGIHQLQPLLEEVRRILIESAAEASKCE